MYGFFDADKVREGNYLLFLPTDGSFPKGWVVYYYQEIGRASDADCRIVIGHSKGGPWSRMGDYKVPCDLRFLAWEPGSKPKETMRHEQFKEYQVPATREWFMPGRRLLIHVDKLKLQWGIPKRLRGKVGNGPSVQRYTSAMNVLECHDDARILLVLLEEILRWREEVSISPRSDLVADPDERPSKSMQEDVVRRWELSTGKTQAFLYDMLGGEDEAVRRIRKAWLKIARDGKEKNFEFYGKMVRNVDMREGPLTYSDIVGEQK